MEYLQIAQLPTQRVLVPRYLVCPMQPDCEVAHVLHHLGKNIQTIGLTAWQLEHFMPLKVQNSRLGGHIDACRRLQPHH